jgi:hypothetical protein
MWKTIVYVNLEAEDLEVDTLDSYINHVDRLCNSIEVKKLDGLQSVQGISNRPV